MSALDSSRALPVETLPPKRAVHSACCPTHLPPAGDCKPTPNRPECRSCFRSKPWRRRIAAVFCDAPTQVSRRTVTMPGPRGLVRPTISRGSFTLALDGLRLASRRGLEGAIQAYRFPLLFRRDVHLTVRHRDEFCRRYLVHPSRDQLNRESEPDHDPGDAARIGRAPFRGRPD